jgi:hypothetical protein
MSTLLTHKPPDFNSFAADGKRAGACIGALAPLRDIQRRIAFIGVARVFARYLPTGARLHLQDIAGEFLRIDRARCTGRPLSSGVNIWLPRPTAELLYAAEEYGILGRVDISCKYFTDDPWTLWSWLITRLRLRWYTGPFRITAGARTAYLGSNENRQILLYWDQPGYVRLNVTLCCPLALRAQQLDTVEQLLAVSPAELFDYNLRFNRKGRLIPVPDALLPDRLSPNRPRLGPSLPRPP